MQQSNRKSVIDLLLLGYLVNKFLIDSKKNYRIINSVLIFNIELLGKPIACKDCNNCFVASNLLKKS